MKKTISKFLNEILLIFKECINAGTEFNENGLPVAFTWEEENNEDDDLYGSTVKNSFFGLNPEEIMRKITEGMQKEREKREYSHDVYVDGIINNVPYDGIFEEGAGFYAHSGTRSINIGAVSDDNFSDTALEKFKIPEREGGINFDTTEKFNVQIIATQEEHDRTMELEATPNFALIRNALSFNGREDYVRLGSVNTKVISVKYDVIEKSPRIANDFQLTDSAMNMLQSNYEKFWREYGDYFVAGYTYGLRFEGIIEIVADSGETCDRVCSLVKQIMEYAQLNAYSERISGAPASNVLENMNNLIAEVKGKYKDVTIFFRNVRQTGSMESDTSDISGFINNLANFIKNSSNVSKKQYEKLYVTLKRYREIDAAKPYINEALSVKKGHYNAIRKLTEKIFRTRCYYNALMSIPEGHLFDGKGKHDEWKNEFAYLIDTMKNSLNYICADTKLIQECDDAFEELFQEYKALAERYNFYRYLVYKQQKDKSPSWSTSDYYHNTTWQRGIRSYDKSSIVQGDFQNGEDYRFLYAGYAMFGTHTPSFKENYEKNQRISWFETGYRATNYCQGQDQNGTTLGKNSLHWEYSGVWGRRLEVFLNVKCVDMPLDKYPFVGL